MNCCMLRESEVQEVLSSEAGDTPDKPILPFLDFQRRSLHKIAVILRYL